MNRSLACVLFALSAAALSAQKPALSLPGPAPELSKEHFQQRRAALRARIGDGVVLLRGGNKGVDMGGFVQLQEFLYLSGVAEPGLAMLLGTGADGAVIDELLVPPFSPMTATWEGEFLAPGDAAVDKTGFATVGNIRQLEARLDALLAEKDGKRPVLWTPLQAEPIVGGTPGSAGGAAASVSSDKLDGRPSREQSLKSKLEAKYPGLEIKDLTSALHTLRGLKMPGEIALLRRSAEIAAEGHVEAMRSARPGLYEFQVAAVARYVFSLRGAGPDAYGAIVGAGKNGCALHYMKNDAELKDGDLVVMDYAATVRGYASDVTRTFPANGHFSKEQRQLVQDIYDVQQQLIAMVKPGAKISSIGDTCNELLSKRGYRVDHGPCHHVGLAVHDPGPDELEAGMVLTVEPGAYLRNKGMGCRIEDTVLVTDQGCEILSAGVPSSPDAVEKLMAQKGMVDVPVGLAKRP